MCWCLGSGARIGGGRLGGATGIAFGTVLGNAVCPDVSSNNKNNCDEKIRQINTVIKELFKRYMGQCRNKKNQWDSHLIAYNNKKIQLGRLVAEAEAMKCLVPPKAYQWLATDCPLPGTKTPSPGY